MLKSEYYIEDIKEQIAIFQHKIELETSLNHHNLKLYGENFFRDILNIIYPKANFTNTNFLESNFPAIDLICHETEKCIQITSNRTRDKIKDTINAYKKSQYDNYAIEIYYLLEKAKPSNIKDLEKELKIEDLSSKLKDSSNLMKNIDNLEVEKLEQVWKLFKIDNEVISFLTQLKERYTTPYFTKLKPLSSLNKDVYLQDIYQDLSIIKKKKNDEEKDKEINIDELLNESKKVSILGKSGIGKSTLTKYICYQWANGKLFNNYDYLFYIPIKKWEKGERIFDVVLKVLKESINITSNDLYEYVKSFKDKTLLVIDGFDEIKDEYREEIEQEIQNFDNYIITSRHNGLKENELNIEETFENEGFNQKSIENFIRHISNSAELIKQINNNSRLEELSKIPMLLDIICYLYKENKIDFTTHFTMTSLYENFLDEIILRFEKERVSQFKNITKEEDKIFFELGKVAFENLKDKKFTFKGTFITRSNRKFIKDELLPFGFLVSLTNERHLKDNQYEFIHLTFQEYFSAFYVASLPEKEQSEIIRDWKFYPHMQMFFAFLGGLIEDKEFLLGEIESEPRDILGIYEFNLMSLSIVEINEIENENLKKRIFKKYFRINKLDNDNTNNITRISHILNNHFYDLFFKEIKYVQLNILRFVKHIKGNSNVIKILITLLKDERSKKHDIRSNILLSFLNLSLNIEEIKPIVIDTLNTINKCDKAKILSYLITNEDKFFEQEFTKTINKKTCSEYIFSLETGIVLLVEDYPKTYIAINYNECWEFKLKKKLIDILIEILQNNNINKQIKFNIALFVFSEHKVINDNSINSLFEIVEKELIFDYELIIMFLLDLSQYSKVINSKFLYIFDTKQLNSLENCQMMEKYFLRNSEILKRKKNPIKDKKLNNKVRVDENNTSFYRLNIGEVLPHSDLIKMIDDKNISIKVREVLLRELKIFLIHRNSLTDIFIDSNSLDGNKIISTFLKILRDKNNKIKIVPMLVSLFSSDKKILIDVLIKLSSMDIDLKNYFYENINFNDLLEVYDRDVHSSKYFSPLIKQEKITAYIKNKKLYTIENGKEISTQREVDEATLNEIKIRLKGDNLDD